MQVEIGKTYMTRNGRFVKLVYEPWKGVYNGEIEPDGRKESWITRWTIDGICRDYLMHQKEPLTDEEHDIIMEDGPAARELAETMKLERKQKAYEETN
jgi:hypothetical protein